MDWNFSILKVVDDFLKFVKMGLICNKKIIIIIIVYVNVYFVLREKLIIFMCFIVDIKLSI